MAPTGPIILKFFSGPHMGAEIPLVPGDVVVGSGENCDVILHDSTVARQHVHITVPADPGMPPVLTLRTLDAQVALMQAPEEAAAPPRAQEGEGGEDAEAQEEPEAEDGLQPFEGEMRWGAAQPVMLGTTCLAWQVEGESWGDIGPAAFLDDRRHKAAEGEAPEAEAEATAKEAEETFKPRSERARRIFKIFAAIAVVLFLSVTFSGGPDTHLAEEMADALEDAGYDYLSVEQTAIGVTIQGEVPMQGDRKALWQLAGTMEFPVFIDVHVREERAQAVRVALAVRGLFPQVDLEDKDIVLTGYFRDKLIEGAAKIWIGEDIRHIGEIRSSMVYAAQVWPVFRDALIRHELNELVVVRLHPGVVEVEGELDFEQRESLEQAKKETRESLNSPIAFWDSLTAPGFSAEWNASINSSRRSAYAPDAALAQLFRDTQALKGASQFAPAPALKATPGATGITTITPTSPLKGGLAADAPEDGVDLGNAPSMDNALGGVVSLVPTEPDHSAVTAARDERNNVRRDAAGQPLLDREGRIVLDDDGKPIAGHPAIVGGEEFTVARDEKGEVMRDEQGRPIMAHAGDVQRDDEGRILRDEKGEPLSGAQGEVLLDAEGRPVVGTEEMIGEEPVHIARDAQGNILRDEEGNMALERGGKILRDAQGNIVSAPKAMIGDAPVRAARDAEDGVLRDAEGRPVLERGGEILRDKDGEPVTGRDDMFRDAPSAVILGKDGEPVLDKDGKPMVVEALRDENGDVLRDKDGNPVFPTVARDKDGEVIRDAEGNPVLLGPLKDAEGRIVRDAEGNPVPTVIARDERGDIILDEQGNPMVVAPVMDELGQVRRDAEGNVIAPRVMTDAEGRPARAPDGSLILVPEDANDVGAGADEAGSLGGDKDKESPDYKQFGAGMGFADAFDKDEEAVDVLGGLSIIGVTLDPVPFISMKDGQKFFTGGRLPTGFIIREISTDKLVVERDGQVVTKIFERR